jgi:uncharacterized protein (DUF302 family)
LLIAFAVVFIDHRLTRRPHPPRRTTMGFTRRIDTDLSYEQVVIAAEAAFADRGFGTLTESRSPRHSGTSSTSTPTRRSSSAPAIPSPSTALDIDPSVATLLPCNVVVRTESGRIVVEALGPAIRAQLSGNAALADVAAVKEA